MKPLRGFDVLLFGGAAVVLAGAGAFALMEVGPRKSQPLLAALFFAVALACAYAVYRVARFGQSPEPEEDPPRPFGAAELEDSLYENIKVLCAEGDALAQRHAYGAAIERYEAAWGLLPQPKTDWNAATWILAAIGDAQFHEGDFAGAVETLQHAMHCPKAIGNPFLHLRLGQSLFETGERQRAMDELARAYKEKGVELFTFEDSKYLKALSQVIELPEGYNIFVNRRLGE